MNSSLLHEEYVNAHEEVEDFLPGLGFGSNDTAYTSREIDTWDPVDNFLHVMTDDEPDFTKSSPPYNPHISSHFSSTQNSAPQYSSIQNTQSQTQQRPQQTQSQQPPQQHQQISNQFSFSGQTYSQNSSVSAPQNNTRSFMAQYSHVTFGIPTDKRAEPSINNISSNNTLTSSNTTNNSMSTNGNLFPTPISPSASNPPPSTPPPSQQFLSQRPPVSSPQSQQQQAQLPRRLSQLQLNGNSEMDVQMEILQLRQKNIQLEEMLSKLHAMCVDHDNKLKMLTEELRSYKYSNRDARV